MKPLMRIAPLIIDSMPTSTPLIYKNPIPRDSSIIDRTTQPLHRIIGIPLNGVHDASITGFHNTHMVKDAITIPIEENDITGAWNVASVLPLSSMRQYRSLHSGKQGSCPYNCTKSGFPSPGNPDFSACWGVSQSPQKSSKLMSYAFEEC